MTFARLWILGCFAAGTELPYWQKIVSQNAIAIRAALNGDLFLTADLSPPF
jgi:hypothetical protein